jgi:hypothetical protein
MAGPLPSRAQAAAQIAEAKKATPAYTVFLMMCPSLTRFVASLCFFVTSLTASCSASAVAIIAHPRLVVMAADSKMFTWEESGAEFSASPSCKMGISTNFVWAWAGTEAKEFDVRDFIRRADMAPGTVKQQADQFVDSARPILKKILWNKEGITVAFAAFRKGKLQLSVRTLSKNAKDGFAMPTKEQYDCAACENVPPIEFGSSFEAEKEWSKNPESFDLSNPVHMAKQFIEREIENDRKYVGPPVSVLTLTPQGRPKWVENGLCK